MEKTTLTLATYNIHSCIGRDGRYDPARIIRVIHHLKADILALQEVTSLYDSDLNLLDRLGEQTGLRVIPGLTMFREAEGYGNAVLTRHRIDRIARLNISVDGREPRGAVSLRLHVNNKDVHIIATHLGLSRQERRAQAARVVKAFQASPADVAVLMGDLNEWVPWSIPLRRLRRFFAGIGAPATFPARFPVLSLDRIMVHPAAYLHGVAAVKIPLARTASDHLPLRAKLVF
jgi:endonuclease/exonuclease/phosphatase family metal-dependent hydrolase